MLKIRLKRVGRKNDPSYRIVVTESSRGPKSNMYVEMIGSYDPRSNTRTIDPERVKHWLSVGAQPSDTVYNILVTEKIIDGKKRNALPRKTPIVKEQTEETTEAKQEAPKAETAEAKEETAAEESADAEAKEEIPQPEVAEPTDTEEKIEDTKEETAPPEEQQTEKNPNEEDKKEGE